MGRRLRWSGIVTGAAALVSCGGAGEAMPRSASAEDIEITRHEFTTTDGLTLHYARLGDSGAPVILIHGSGGMAQTWLDNGVAHALAEDGFYERTHRLGRELKNFQSIRLEERGHLSSYYPGVIPDEYLHGIVTFINSHDEP